MLPVVLASTRLSVRRSIARRQDRPLLHCWGGLRHLRKMLWQTLWGKKDSNL
jgi:hypothetical protein